MITIVFRLPRFSAHCCWSETPVPTPLNFRSRPSRTKTVIEAALPLAQRFMMIAAAVIIVLMLAQLNATSTAAAIRHGQLPVIATYLP
jgi:hypothetical protein